MDVIEDAGVGQVEVVADEGGKNIQREEIPTKTAEGDDRRFTFGFV